MDTKTVYSNKAENYARYRWDYNPEAIETIFRVANLDNQSTIADIGAGTGILTRHFSGRVGKVYAIEPNSEMLRFAQSELSNCGVCEAVQASAEHTTLPDSSVDLITVAQAIHWFNPEPTRDEFRRILKPGGWLAVVGNTSTNDALNLAISELYRSEYGFETQVPGQRPAWKPIIYFYGNGRFQCIRYPFSFIEDWDRFLGSLLSTAGMPDLNNSRYAQLETAARQVFERFSQDGKLEVRGTTELFIGQVTGIS